jgi:hypothetical protein
MFTAMLLVALSSTLTVRSASAAFTDVKATHWAAESIEKAAPFLECRFNGDRPLTRSEAAETASRILESWGVPISTVSAKQILKDVPADDPAHDAILRTVVFRAMAARDESGKPGGTEFRGGSPVTRFEMASIVARLCRAKALAGSTKVPVNFTDVPADHWAFEAVQGAVDSGVLQGWEGKFNGEKQITRYQAAVIVKKILEVPGLSWGKGLAP